jgi:uncharacterized protein (DUF486 family)
MKSSGEYSAQRVVHGITREVFGPAPAANRLGFAKFSDFRLKIIQEGITISVFIVFAITFLKGKLAWNNLVRSPFPAWPHFLLLHSRHLRRPHNRK